MIPALPYRQLALTTAEHTAGVSHTANSSGVSVVQILKGQARGLWPGGRWRALGSCRCLSARLGGSREEKAAGSSAELKGSDDS